MSSAGGLFADHPELDLAPHPLGDRPLRTMGDLAAWLDSKPSPALFAYLMYGRGEVERMACFAALVRRELRHQLGHHCGGGATGSD